MMNERILELARQAANGMLSYDAEGECRLEEKEVEKFAELIVRECAAYIFVLDAEPVSHKSAARMLMDHFGVK